MPDKKYKLLAADDHRLFVEGLHYVLKKEMNIEITDFAYNGKEAIDKCRAGDFDAVLMDINMPVIDGITATAEIKQLFPHIKVIILSSANDMQTIANAIRSGANAFILKEEGSAELLKALKSINKNDVYLSPSIAHLFSNQSFNPKTRTDYIKFSESIITPREQSILKLIADGYTNQAIADSLFISVKTVDTHRKNMLAKLKLPNTAALVKFGIENKLI